VHADSEEQGSSLRCNIQNIANDGFLFDLNSHNMTSYHDSCPIITLPPGKNKRGKQVFPWKLLASSGGKGYNRLHMLLRGDRDAAIWYADFDRIAGN
jgi:hypothetical protein